MFDFSRGFIRLHGDTVKAAAWEAGCIIGFVLKAMCLLSIIVLVGFFWVNGVADIAISELASASDQNFPLYACCWIIALGVYLILLNIMTVSRQPVAQSIQGAFDRSVNFWRDCKKAGKDN